MRFFRFVRRSVALQCTLTAGFGLFAVTTDRDLLRERLHSCTIINNPSTKEKLKVRFIPALKPSNIVSDEERRCVSAVVSLIGYNADIGLTTSYFAPKCRVEGPVSVLNGRQELYDFLSLGTVVTRLITVNSMGLQPVVTGLLRGKSGEIHIDFETTIPMRFIGWTPVFKSTCRCLLTNSVIPGEEVPSKWVESDGVNVLAVQHRWFHGAILGSPSFDDGSWATRFADGVRRFNGLFLATAASVPRVVREFNEPPVTILYKTIVVEKTPE